MGKLKNILDKFVVEGYGHDLQGEGMNDLCFLKVAILVDIGAIIAL